MNNTLVKWAYPVLVAAGAVMAGAFFVDWIRDYGDGGASGWALAKDQHWLYLVPISGLALAVAAEKQSRYTRIIALFAGLLVAGDFAYHLFGDVIHWNLQTWLLLGGAAVTLAGISPERRVLRAVGGGAVLLALFAPWQRSAMFTVSVFDLSHIFSLLGVAMLLILGSMVAAVVAIASAFTTAPWGKTAAVVAGVLVFVSYFAMLLAIANMFFDWGAWSTLGGSAVALAIAALAPAARKATAAA
ncbi:MAG TPA: hypothetical protein VGF94_11750 [Kofleriaceae bacterium]